jgi:hypothetical protein
MPGDVDASGYEVPHPSLECELYKIRGTLDSEPTNIPLPSTSPTPMAYRYLPGTPSMTHLMPTTAIT